MIGSCEGGLLVNNVGSFGEGGGGEKIVDGRRWTVIVGKSEVVLEVIVDG